MLSLIMCAAAVAGPAATKAPDSYVAQRGTETGFLFRTLKHETRSYPYAVYVPRDYTAERRWPVIVFLHGAGECGTDGAKQIAQGLGSAILLDAAKWPFIVLFPQKPDVRDSWDDHAPAVMAMLKETHASWPTDSARIYLTGLSQGGHGTWAIGARHADVWAAIAPICGYADAAAVATPLKDVPVWCFHGEADTVVPPARSTSVVEAIKAAGGTPKLTIYPGVGHNSWDKASREEALAAWFLEHARPTAPRG